LLVVQVIGPATFNAALPFTRTVDSPVASPAVGKSMRTHVGDGELESNATLPPQEPNTVRAPKKILRNTPRTIDDLVRFFDGLDMKILLRHWNLSPFALAESA